MRNMIVTAAAVAAIAVPLAGCGAWSASHDYNAPTPVKAWQPKGGWTRIETPGNFPSMVFGCHGRDGIYDNRDGGSSPFVVPDDPECPA